MKPAIRALVDDTAPATVEEDAHGDVRMTQYGDLHVSPHDSSGNFMNPAIYLVTDDGNKFTVTASGSDAFFLTANANRSAIYGYNGDPAESLYLNLGTDAATTSPGGFQVVIPPLSHIPAWFNEVVWKGAIRCIWSGSPTVDFTGIELEIDQ